VVVQAYSIRSMKDAEKEGFLFVTNGSLAYFT
jgi:hypothetical protein